MGGTDVADAERGGKRAPEVHVLHRGAKYCVRFVHCNDDPWAVVCFEYWKPEPTLDGEFSGEGFFRHRGLNAFGIMAASNDWFQDDEILQALAAIRAASPGWRLIGYGGSMGGFAAINFAHDLGLASLVAVIPQYSIDAARAPYETRWRGEAAQLSFAHDKIDRIPPVVGGWAIFDPWCVDGRHMADIQRHHRLRELRIPFGGHAQMLMLQQADVYTDMFTDMLEERFDSTAFRRRWRVARRRSAAFWLGMAQALLGRANPHGALRALAQARALPHPEPGWIDLTEADARIALGEIAAARRLADAWANDPAFGGPARERLARLPPPPAPSPPAPHPAPLWRRAARRLRRAVRAALG
jgi:hypothetical protein